MYLKCIEFLLTILLVLEFLLLDMVVELKEGIYLQILDQP